MISYTITKHNVVFPTKIASAEGANHIYNITLTEDMDNGTLVGRGDWIKLDQYKQTAVPTTGSGSSASVDFAGIVREKAANGNWYVEVTANTEALWIYDAVVIAEDFTREFTDEANFYNESGKTVKAYTLIKGDIIEMSRTAFSNTPVAGKTVSYNATTKKYVVAS